LLFCASFIPFLTEFATSGFRNGIYFFIHKCLLRRFSIDVTKAEAGIVMIA